MHTITLLSTMHKESGNCNSGELHNLIEFFKPEIIFEELSHSDFVKSYTDNSLVTLESKAIKRYLLNHDIKIIPVDTYDIPVSYYNKIDTLYSRLFNCIRIPECRRLRNLMDEKDILVSQQGFRFLNSAQNDILFENVHALEEKILDSLKDENLSGIHRLKKEVVERREDEMLQNIYDYRKNNAYEQALFFIGSGHRASIIRKIEEYKTRKETKLNWIFFKSYANTY